MTKVFDNSFSKAFLLIILAHGLIWLKSGYGKISGGKFVDSLDKVLTKFASDNPYPAVKGFLESTAIPNAKLFGVLTMWGELLVAVSLVAGALYFLFNKDNRAFLLFLAAGLLGGAFLNFTFWLAAGWTSASTDTVNLLMAVIETIGFVVVASRLRRS